MSCRREQFNNTSDYLRNLTTNTDFSSGFLKQCKQMKAAYCDQTEDLFRDALSYFTRLKQDIEYKHVLTG